MTTLGVLYPGHAAEDDYPTLASLLTSPVEVIVVHTPDEPSNTIEDARRTGDPERLRQGVHDLRRRCAALHRRVDAVVWACTAGSFVFGLGGAREQARDIALAAGVQATSTSLAFIDACRITGATRVAV